MPNTPNLYSYDCSFAKCAAVCSNATLCTGYDWARAAHDWARAAYDGPPLPWSDDDGGAGDDDGDAIAWRRRVVAQCAPAAFAPVLVLSPRT